jgi:NADPH:quinone reductase-like Zn-dependent oxidoreductase
VVVTQHEALPIPAGMSFPDAAAIPEAFLTAYDALVHRARLQTGERVLIHAVGSGVGTAAVQVARLLGAVTIGTSRTPAKLERARALGLGQGIDTSAVKFREAIQEPVDVIIDMLGGPAFADNLELLAPRGRLIMLGFLAGTRTTADLTPILRKRLEVIGSVMRARGLEERVPLIREFTEHVLPAFSHGQLHPVVGATYPMSDLPSAHIAMEKDETFGKVVLTW